MAILPASYHRVKQIFVFDAVSVYSMDTEVGQTASLFSETEIHCVWAFHGQTGSLSYSVRQQYHPTPVKRCQYHSSSEASLHEDAMSRHKENNAPEKEHGKIVEVRAESANDRPSKLDEVKRRKTYAI
jgi:hypothetical protein